MTRRHGESSKGVQGRRQTFAMYQAPQVQTSRSADAANEAYARSSTVARSSPRSSSPLGPSRFSTAPTGSGRSGRGSGSTPARHGSSSVRSTTRSGEGTAAAYSGRAGPATQPRQRRSRDGSASISSATAYASAETCSQRSPPPSPEHVLPSSYGRG